MVLCGGWLGRASIVLLRESGGRENISQVGRPPILEKGNADVTENNRIIALW